MIWKLPNLSGRYLVYIMASILFCFGSLEILARVYIHVIADHELRDHYYGGRAFEFYQPTYIRLRAGATVTEVHGGPYAINSEGTLSDTFRDSPNAIKVLAIGGSTSFGMNYMARVKKLYLEIENAPIPQNIVFASAGTPGYSTTQSLINFQLRLLPLRPDIIVVYHAVNDFNPLKIKDPDPNDIFSYLTRTNTIFGSRPNFRDGILDKSAAYTLMYNKLLLLKQKFVAKPFTKEETELVTIFSRNMKSLVGMAAAHDVEVILVTFAHNSLDRRSDKGWGNIQADEAVAYGIQRHNRIIKELAIKHSITLLDLDAELTGRSEYFKDFVHFTPKGADRFAELLLPIVIEKAEKLHTSGSLKETAVSSP